MPIPDAMPLRSQIALDASVAAHRQLLVLMLTVIGRDEATRGALMDAIAQKLAVHDANEDPGIEPDPAFAFERRVDEELRRILSDVQAALAARR